jgi:SAM-dependent methyltransferase
MSQERAFLDGEADAWMRRNSASLSAASPDDPILAALGELTLNERGALLDVGGASGRIAAGFLRDHPEWSVRVVEPSGEAIAAGRKLFEGVMFDQGSITNPLPAPSDGTHYDVVVISGVLCWVERALLSRAIANSDAALSDGGLLVIADFDPPAPRANPYHHAPGIFTYKQDYAQSFLSLGIYHLEYRRTVAHGSGSNPGDPYDRHWMTAVLRKDLHGRYAR